ncbi:hypothetical protein CLV84_2103 [Neolewinella xylanilytica]|uniref:Uncharacterized protein n=1 Tax=Neolewinella xylanilytica TaxID=1514080 RepID=A0A2S6I299_9BACT|nr:hypothetical protein CLV84_2103 [Neolewinella xylanilytica]
MPPNYPPTPYFLPPTYYPLPTTPYPPKFFCLQKNFPPPGSEPQPPTVTPLVLMME